MDFDFYLFWFLIAAIYYADSKGLLSSHKNRCNFLSAVISAGAAIGGALLNRSSKKAEASAVKSDAQVDVIVSNNEVKIAEIERDKNEMFLEQRDKEFMRSAELTEKAIQSKIDNDKIVSENELRSVREETSAARDVANSNLQITRLRAAIGEKNKPLLIIAGIGIILFSMKRKG